MIIGLTGYKRSGKTEVYRMLNEAVGTAVGSGAIRRRFAQSLKDMLKAVGLEDEHVDGKLKELPCDLLGGQTPRWAMQTLGTEWGRNLIHPNLWVIFWIASTSAVVKAAPWHCVVADDVRFPNEVDAVHSLGGQVWRISRPGCVSDGHESESHIETLAADWEIKNDSSLDWLQTSVEYALDAMKARATTYEMRV